MRLSIIPMAFIFFLNIMYLIFVFLITAFGFIYTPTPLCLNGSHTDLQIASDLMIKEKKGRNVVFSPSVTKTLLMIIGSLIQGEERDTIKQKLRIPLEEITLETALKQSDLNNETATTNIFVYKEDPQKWLTEKYMYEIQQAQSQTPQFHFLGEGGAKAINDLVRSKTNGRITDLIDSDPNERETVLGATLYFKGDWQEEFSPGKTQSFQTENGLIVQTGSMAKTGYYKYHRDTSGNTLIRIPYKKDNMVMDIAMANSINDQVFQTIDFIETLNNASKDEIRLIMPEWCQSSTIDLKGFLSDFGLKNLFQRDGADFAPSMKFPAYIKEAKLKTTVDVDKNGTTAASACYVQSVCYFSATPPSPEVVINKPFYYFIHNGKRLLFCGYIQNPNEK